jgi:hypothetical protein
MSIRFRFRLRTLLALTALVAAACWWVTRPTVVANRFLRAMEARDYGAADQLFSDPSDAVQSRIREAVGNWPLMSTECVLAKATWADWLAGRRTIHFDIRYPEMLTLPHTIFGPGPHRTDVGFEQSVRFETVATPFHLKSPEQRK